MPGGGFMEALTGGATKSSSSCPADLRNNIKQEPFLTDEDARAWAKERQKKDNHNQSMYIVISGTSFERPPWREATSSGKATW